MSRGTGWPQITVDDIPVRGERVITPEGTFRVEQTGDGVYLRDSDGRCASLRSSCTGDGLFFNVEGCEQDGHVARVLTPTEPPGDRLWEVVRT